MIHNNGFITIITPIKSSVVDDNKMDVLHFLLSIRY